MSGNLREQLAQADEQEWYRLSRHAQLQYWRRGLVACPRCATALVPHVPPCVCPGCGHEHYPRLDPCVLVLVTRGSQCLLAHAARFAATPVKRFSVLAGFVEPGESAEQAAQREVREEVGIEIATPRYVASQSWPFPHALMLGYQAEYVSGELQPDGSEILEAGWFTRDSLPDLPPPMSLSRQLIDRFFSG